MIVSPPDYNGELVPKLVLSEPFRYAHHRSGWQYAIHALQPLIRASQPGVRLVPLMERLFVTDLAENLRDGRLPCREPWIGFCHVPPDVPEWSDRSKSPLCYMRSPAFQESLPFCRGVITLSEQLRCWVAEHLDVPTLALVHPTEVPDTRFSLDAYLNSPRRSILHVGWWLRRFSSFVLLPVAPSRKVVLLPYRQSNSERVHRAIDAERRLRGLPPFHEWDVTVLPWCENECYDRLLSESLVFVDLHSASANNIVIECIVRATPLLVNPLPAVVEYLGEHYPYYYRSLEEAAAKAESEECVGQAHEYLRNLPLERFSAERFRNDLANSALYQGL